MVNQLKMADTQTILALHSKGWSARRIARELKMDRQTVGRYIRLGREADSKPANAPFGSGGSDQAVAPKKPKTPIDSQIKTAFFTPYFLPWITKTKKPRWILSAEVTTVIPTT